MAPAARLEKLKGNLECGTPDVHNTTTTPAIPLAEDMFFSRCDDSKTLFPEGLNSPLCPKEEGRRYT